MLSFTGEQLEAYYVSMKTIPGIPAGRRLFQKKGCQNCHSLGGKGGSIGPALDQVAKRHDPAGTNLPTSVGSRAAIVAVVTRVCGVQFSARVIELLPLGSELK